MGNPVLPGLGEGAAAEPARRPGRPRGSANKRNADLLNYLTAFYGGLTPGQQLAAVGLVTDKEVRAARKAAKAAGVDPIVMAMMMKAAKMARALRCKASEAWAMMASARAELMPYVHQRRPQAVDLTTQGEKIRPVIMGLPTTAPVVRFGGDLIEGEAQQLQALNDMRPAEVAHPKSHDD